jgi:hypothetical protein
MKNLNNQLIFKKADCNDDFEEFTVRFNGKTLSFVNEFMCGEDATLGRAFKDVYEIPEMIIDAFKLGQENPTALISVVETEDI